MKIRIFKHSASNTQGTLLKIFKSMSDDVESVLTFHDDIDTSDADSADLLVVLGGQPGAYQTDAYPFMSKEIDIIEKRAAKDMPTLGVCLGTQLMAKALGADVYPGSTGQEIGWNPVKLTDAGKQSPVRHLGEDQSTMFHWHGDTFDLPDGAVHLASSSKYKHQAYSYGKNLLGLQCHPEVTKLIIQNWLVAAAAQVARGKIDIKTVQAETEKYLPKLIQQSEIFLTEWLECVGLKA